MILNETAAVFFCLPIKLGTSCYGRLSVAVFMPMFSSLQLPYFVASFFSTPSDLM